MRSYISSFRPELKAIVILLILILLGEVAMRMFGPSFSTEIRQISSLPVEAAKMASMDGTRVLVLGNSITNQGFNAEVFSEETSTEKDAPVYVQVRYFPSSTIIEWVYIFKHFFIDDNRLPDVLILPFNIESIRDTKKVNIGRLSNFVGTKDLANLLYNDLHFFDDRVEFIHSYLFASFANREKVRQKVLDLFIPSYRNGETAVHESIKKTNQEEHGDVDFGYKQLKRLLSMAQQYNIRIFCVFMPTLGDYALDAELLQTVNESGSALIDLRKLEGITKDHFESDGLHLKPKGAAITTTALARQLQKDFPHIF